MRVHTDWNSLNCAWGLIMLKLGLSEVQLPHQEKARYQVQKIYTNLFQGRKLSHLLKLKRCRLYLVWKMLFQVLTWETKSSIQLKFPFQLGMLGQWQQKLHVRKQWLKAQAKKLMITWFRLNLSKALSSKPILPPRMERSSHLLFKTLGAPHDLMEDQCWLLNLKGETTFLKWLLQRIAITFFNHTRK